MPEFMDEASRFESGCLSHDLSSVLAAIAVEGVLLSEEEEDEE